MIASSRIESSAEVGRDDGEQVVAPSENTMANACDELVDHIPHSGA